MTRVLFVDHETRLSGGERDLVDLVRGLHVEEGSSERLELHAAVPSSGPLGDALESLGVEVHVVPMADDLRTASRWELQAHPWQVLRHVTSAGAAAGRLTRLARALRPDVIHSNSMKAHVLSIPAARIIRRPLVWHVRDIVEPGWLRRGVRALARIGPRRIVCISEAVADALRDGNLGRKLRVVHNGVRPAQPEIGEVARARDALGAGPGDVVVGIVGQVARWKGQDLFVDAAASVLPRDPKARFVVVGECLFPENESEFADTCRRRLDGLGAGGRARWHGPADPVEPVMAALDVLVHASRRPEPFGRVIVEGMALGVPVIASTEGAGPEIVTPGAGLLVEPDSGALTRAVDHLLAEPTVRRRLAAQGRRRAQEFDIARTASGVRRVWQEIGAPHSARTRRGDNGGPSVEGAVTLAYVAYGEPDQAMLAGLRRAGAAVVVMPRSGGAGRYPREDRSPLALLSRVAFVLKGAAWLRARRRQLDVAVAVDNRTAALSANLGRIIGGPPVLLQVHEPGGALVGGGGPVRRRLASFVERLVGVLDEWAAAAVGAATFAGGRDAAGRADPVAVIPWCGVDLEVFAPRDRARARHELGWPVDGAVVLGRSEAVSTADAETFVTAMAGLKARRAAVTVAFLGPGYDLVRRAGERVGLEVLGRAAADEGRRALWCAGADVVVQLDGGARVAIPALEALACATPVVGAHGEGLLEALDGGRLGTIVPSGEARMLADAVERTICDPSARRRAATAGRPHVASLFGATAAFDDWVGLARLVAAGERTTCGGRPWGRRRRSQPSTPTGVPVTLLSSAAAPGGAERALAALAQELRGRGFAPRALLLAHGPVERWMEEAGCAVDVVPAPRRPILQMAALAPVAVRIAWHLHRHRPVALVSNHAKGHIFGGTAALLAGVPAVFWQQGVPVARLAERVAAKVPCRAVLASSDEAVEAQRKLVSRRPVVKVPLGIDVTAVASRRGSGRAMRSELAGRDEVLVGMVGRLERWKGQHVFLEAAANVAGRRAHVSFAVIGGAVLGWEGTYEEELHALGDRLGIADRVVFTGHQEDAIACMDALDVVVHASVEPEAFGLVVVEAMALGKPVVAAGAGGPLEIVEDGISGLLTPPGDAKALADAVVGLVDDPDRRLAMGRRAQDRARCFDQGRMAEAIAALLVAPRGGADGQLNGGTTDMRLVHCGTRAPGGS